MISNFLLMNFIVGTLTDLQEILGIHLKSLLVRKLLKVLLSSTCTLQHRDVFMEKWTVKAMERRKHHLTIINER